MKDTANLSTRRRMNRSHKNQPGEKPAGNAGYIHRLVHETGRQLSGPEPLASMDYRDEIRCKDRAFSSYWYELTRACPAAPIVESPLPRRYRTTSKRRAHRRGGGLVLSSDESALSDAPSLLEPGFHADIFSRLGSVLNENANRKISGCLNFAVIRGGYDSAALIFNVTEISAAIVNAFTGIAERLKESNAKLDAAFLYHDPEGSKYYFNTSSEIDGPRMKRLFGPGELSVTVNEVRYAFAPECFSQVNLSICGAMLDTAKRLLEHGGGGRLVDLYSGYGFFSCFLAGDYDEVIGVDYGRAAIESARDNMKRSGYRGRWDFHARRIDRKNVSALPQTRLPEYFLLDPPRSGTAPGVIENIASRGPELALNVFCGLETIPGELARWAGCGYGPVECVPLDMFPGTPEIEVMVLLKKDFSIKREKGRGRGRKERRT